jgi:hypothetical protein
VPWGLPRAARRFRNDLAFAFTDHFHERLLDFGERRVERRATRINDDVPLRRKREAVHSKSLAQPALDAIAHDSSTQRARGGDAQAWTNRAVSAGKTECRQQRIRDAQTLVINGSKFSGAQNPRRLRKGERGPRCAAGGGVSWIWQSVLLFRR